MTTRRNFIRQIGLGGSSLISGISIQEIIKEQKAPAIHFSDKLKPQIPSGVASGDFRLGEAVLWSRTDRPSKMMVEISTTESMKNARLIHGPVAWEHQAFTTKINLNGLPPNQRIFYRIHYRSLEDYRIKSKAVKGQLITPPSVKRDIKFFWSGDTAGQGWGINEEWGGMRIYKTMENLAPDFFIHSGDSIYADGPIETEVKLADGSIWKNIVTEGVSKVAETLEEFRANYAYNLMDEHVRNFNAHVPVIYQWDDHETVNNWYPHEILDDERYKVKSVDLLAARGKQAFIEFNPIRSNGNDPDRLYRRIPYGPSLDVFVIDMRSYRGPNTPNRQTRPSDETVFIGRQQLNWLKEGLKRSQATWKVIAADMPIGLMVPDYNLKQLAYENMANGPGEPLGRELEMKELLTFLKQHGIQNTLWLTADVHYTAAHYYDPNKAVFQDFLPFYEFVSGPLHSGSFGPNQLDNTFGPQVLFKKHLPIGTINTSPMMGHQFFGEVFIDGKTEELTINLRDLEGVSVYELNLTPQIS